MLFGACLASLNAIDRADVNSSRWSLINVLALRAHPRSVDPILVNKIKLDRRFFARSCHLQTSSQLKSCAAMSCATRSRAALKRAHSTRTNFTEPVTTSHSKTAMTAAAQYGTRCSRTTADQLAGGLFQIIHRPTPRAIFATARVIK